MSNSVQDITNQLRACNFEHVRAIIEPDDVMVLIDYLEGQGFTSAEVQAALDAEAAESTETASEEAPDLSEFTKDELLAMAEEQGIEVAKSKTKAKIIEAIEGGNE